MYAYAYICLLFYLRVKNLLNNYNVKQKSYNMLKL